MTLGLKSSRRTASSWEAKPPNTVLEIAPIRAQAITATSTWGTAQAGDKKG